MGNNNDPLKRLKYAKQGFERRERARAQKAALILFNPTETEATIENDEETPKKLERSEKARPGRGKTKTRGDNVKTETHPLKTEATQNEID